MSSSGRIYILITWPESQDFIDAPGAFLVNNPDVAGSSAYMVPEEVFQNYRVPFYNGSSYVHGPPPAEEGDYFGDDDNDDDYSS